MRRAYSLIEIIFIIIITGIIVKIALPKFKTSRIYEARDQIVSHIRYTQHLALMDNRFDISNPNWFKEYWRIQFNNSNVTGQLKPTKDWRYTVFRDHGMYSGNPNSLQYIANDPTNPQRKLTSGWNGQNYKWQNLNTDLNLTETFGIVDMKFKDCGSRGQTISFDNQGRPSANMNNATNPFDKLFQENCVITIMDYKKQKIDIIVHRETGYVTYSQLYMDGK